MIDLQRLFDIFIFLGSVFWIFYVIKSWINEKRGEDAFIDYTSNNPPLYVYYFTSGIPIPMPVYLVFSGWFSFVLGLVTSNFLNNTIAGLIVGAITLYQLKQQIILRSIRKSQVIDERLSEFLYAFYNVYQLHQNPIDALEYANKTAHKTFRKPLVDLHWRLVNKSEPSEEIQKTKLMFKNRILRDFLDSLEADLQEGYGFESRIRRLIERSENRKTLAKERRIETFGGVYLIKIGTVLFFITATIFLWINPDYLAAFQENTIARFSVNIMIIITALMTFAAQKLILLSEG